MSSTTPRAHFPALLLTVLAVVASAQPAAAQIQCAGWDSAKSPADPPPSSLWFGLEPAYDEGGLPSCGGFGNPTCEERDTTYYNQATTPHYGVAYWQAIDIKQGYAFLANSLGFQIWNLNTNPESPDRLSYPNIVNFAPVITGESHQYDRVWDISASEDGNLAAITGGYSLGMLIVNTQNKTVPSLLYQDPAFQSAGKDGGRGVHVQTINGRVYGFLASVGHPNDRGLWAYDLTRASELPATPCVEPNATCSGVFKGRYSTNRLAHVDGAGDDANGHFIVASGGFDSSTENQGFKVWRVNNPSAPVEVLSGHAGRRVDGVALWKEGTKFFLALANRGPGGAGPSTGEIYDVTCIKTGSCGSLPSLRVYDFPLAGFTGAFNSHDSVVQDSVDGSGRPWVYFGFRFGQGAQNPSGTVLQMEWLLNVAGISLTNPPTEITGGDPRNGNLPQSTMQVGSPPITVGYWSYMYYCHPSGSNYYRGNGGQFWGNRFYRAGNTIFDIHRLNDIAPQIIVTGPPTGFTGVAAGFSASASGCSPAPSGWNWTATGGGQVVGGGTTATASIQWSTTGTKTVTATNSACPGSTVVGATIQIVNAAPAIGNVTASPSTAPVCTPITFTGNNVTGQPPLTTIWTIEQGGNPVPGEGGPGNPFVWNTEGISPGTYAGRLTVTGPGGSANAASPPVTLTALQPLPVGGYPITNEAPTFGTVQFHSAAATGATEWRWDFDGDPGGPNTFDLITTDPVIGPNPVHSYATVGTKHVWLEVRNCTTVVWVRSARLDVEITEVAPLLINDFRANCSFGVCGFSTGQSISFFHDVDGDPDTYEYDWTNDGNDPFQVEQTSTNPINTHAYTAAGSYRPVLRIKRGAESVSFTHAATINVSTGGPPPPPPPPPPGPTLTITGPTSLNIGQEGNYSASAANCTPNPNGWTWVSSGSSGSSTTNQITLSWSSTGVKTVSVSNSGCAGAVDTHAVNVTQPGGGPNPGGIEASFTVSPQQPGVGQQVTFDASGSTGAPTGFVWDFGDGTGGSGQQVNHTYAQPGDYEVSLTVSKVVPGSGCGAFGQEICTDTAEMDVTVGEGGGGDCVADANTLCLLGGRFKVTAHWHNHRNGQTGTAKVYTPFSGDRTGMFWFFSADNVELIVKSLDATDPETFPNPAFWFFYGGLSDVEYWVDVVDTVTGQPKQYHNAPGVICGVPDTSAFEVEPETQVPEPVQGGGPALGAAAAFGDDDSTFDLGLVTGAGSSGTCVPNGNNLCLLEGRFSVEVEWHDQHNNTDGIGHPIAGTDRTGYFWFFNADNVELVTKFINGTSVNGHYWMLWGGLSDVEYTIHVTDTVSGTQRSWDNPPGSFCGGAAANAFPGN